MAADVAEIIVGTADPPVRIRLCSIDDRA